MLLAVYDLVQRHKVIVNDAGLADVIKKQKSTDTETADFISAFIKHKKIFQERDTNEVNIMNGLALWGQKLSGFGSD